MVKKGKKMDEKTLEDLKKSLGKKCACYVLISCQEPAVDGSMQVELHYEGDDALASYLLDSAQKFFIKESDESIQA